MICWSYCNKGVFQDFGKKEIFISERLRTEPKIGLAAKYALDKWHLIFVKDSNLNAWVFLDERSNHFGQNGAGNRWKAGNDDATTFDRSLIPDFKQPGVQVIK